MIFSSTFKSFELRVSITEWSGHFKWRANEAYDSRSESWLAAFKVITNEELSGFSLNSSKNLLATRPASCDLPLPGFPEMYRKLNLLSLDSFNSLSSWAVLDTSRSRPPMSWEGLGGRIQNEGVSFWSWSSRTWTSFLRLSTFFRSFCNSSVANVFWFFISWISPVGRPSARKATSTLLMALWKSVWERLPCAIWANSWFLKFLRSSTCFLTVALRLPPTLSEKRME